MKSDSRKSIREARGWMDELQRQDGNEAETRRRIERMLERICGYDAFKHLSREDSVKGAGETEYADFTVRVKSDKIALVIEVKRINVDLSKKHLNQAEQYATKLGCEWIIVSNGRQWQLHHWDPSPPAELLLLASWDLMHDDIKDLEKGFDLISFSNVKKGGLDKLWQKEKSLTPQALIEAIFSEPAMSRLCAVLRKNAGHRPNPEDVVAALRKIFNNNALQLMDKVKICLPTLGKPRTRKKAPPVETKSEHGDSPPAGNSGELP